MILDESGKPLQSQKDLPCPNCGADSKRRVPSSGFGSAYYVCEVCAYEFKDLKVQRVSI